MSSLLEIFVGVLSIASTSLALYLTIASSRALRALSIISISFLFFLSFASTTSLTAEAHNQPLKPDPKLQKPISAIGAWGIPVSPKIGAMTMHGTYLNFVNSDGRAGKSGLRKGDIIVSVNAIETSDPAQINRIVQKLQGNIIQVDYLRDAGKRFEAKRAFLLEMNPSTANGGNKNNTASNTRAADKDIPVMEALLLKLIEQDRSKNGLTTPLKPSTRLSCMARAYADDLAKRGFKGHVDPEGRKPVDRAKLQGITPKAHLAENCSYPFYSANHDEMVERGERDLMESDDHRANILNPKNVSVGVGISFRRDGGLYVVQEFSGEAIP